MLVAAPAAAQPDRLERALATLPAGPFETQAWHPDQSSQAFVYVLAVTGRPRGKVYQPSVRDLGLLQRSDVVRAVRADAPDERAAANVLVDPLRNSGGEPVAYVVHHRDVQVSSTFTRDGAYTVYLRRAGEPMEMGGGGGGGGGM